MASPFKAFRKHQKLLIVIFGIGLMVSFLVVGSISQFLPGGSMSSQGQMGGGNAPVFSWKGGTVDETEIARMQRANSVAARFTNDVYAKARELGGFPQAEPIRFAPGERALVYTMLLAQKAEQIGVVVDDVAISTYLNELGDGRVNSEMRYQLFSKIPGQSGSQSALMERLRVELLARQMEMLAHSGFAAMTGGDPRNPSPWRFHETPIDTWESYNSMMRQVRAELYPVAVADFLDEIEDPSGATLREYYEKYKTTKPNPASPKPGFLKPERSKFAYVRAEYVKYLEQEKQKITDEQVKEYYEAHKSDFVAPELPPAEDDGSADTEAPKDTDAPKDQGTKKDETADSDDAPAPPGSDTPDATNKNGSAEKKEGGEQKDNGSNEKKGGGQPQDKGKAAPEDKDNAASTNDAKNNDAKNNDAKQQDGAAGQDGAKKQDSDPAPKPEGAARTGGSRDAVAFEPAVLTALQTVGQSSDSPDRQETDSNGEDPTKTKKVETDGKDTENARSESQQDASAEEKTDAKPPGAQQPGSDKDTAEKDTADKDTAEKDTAEKDTAEKDTADKDTADKAAGAEEGKPTGDKPDGGDDSTAKANPPQEKEPKYQPLEKVEDQIREELADKNAARAKMIAAIDKASDRLGTYQRHYNLWESGQGDVASSKPPKAPSPADLAEGLLLSGDTTKLMNEFEAEKSDLGGLSQQMGQNRRLSFLEMFYGTRSDHELYRGRRLSVPNAQAPNDIYLIWRTEYEEERVPEFAAIRDDVLRAWKMEQARPLAEKRAAELAEKARKHPQQTLQQSLGKAAVTTDLFSRMTGMSGQTMSVDGVEYTGTDFLDAVFMLEQGQIDTAMDAPQEHAYVIRLVEEGQSVEERLKMYMMFARGGFPLNAGDRLYADWYSDLEKEMDLQWERDPHRFEM